MDELNQDVVAAPEMEVAADEEKKDVAPEVAPEEEAAPEVAGEEVEAAA